MDRSEWLAKRNNGGNIGKFNKARERMIHTAAAILHVPNPGFNPELPVSPLNVMTVPVVQKPGNTYSVGRNKAKRENRRKDIVSRKAVRKIRA